MIRIFRHYVPKSLVILGGAEFALLFGATYLGVTISFLDFNPTRSLIVGQVWTKALLFAVFMMLCMAAMGLYERGLRDDLKGVLLRVFIAFALGLPLLYSLQGAFPALAVGSTAFWIAGVCSLVGVGLLRGVIYRFVGNSLFRRRVLVLGAGALASQIEQLRRRTDRRDMDLVGYVKLRGETAIVDPSKIRQIRTTLLALALELRVDEIVVGVEERHMSVPVNEILDCKMNGIQVIDLLGFFEQQTGKMKLDAMTPSSMIFADGFIQAVLRSSVHRGFDILVSLAVLSVTWPIMLLTAAAIWVESGFRGPILYRQIRVGRHGRPFAIIKFRSMSVDAESHGKPQWAKANDARVTRIGAFIRKTRIDELPQLFNVLRGQMSFVGPRPERPEFVAELSRKIPYFDLRHQVNPGITGWAQICYPYGASDRDAKEKLQYDLYYIKNYSLFLDLMILVQTAQVILWGKGAR